MQDRDPTHPMPSSYSLHHKKDKRAMTLPGPLRKVLLHPMHDNELANPHFPHDPALAPKSSPMAPHWCPSLMVIVNGLAMAPRPQTHRQTLAKASELLRDAQALTLNRLRSNKLNLRLSARCRSSSLYISLACSYSSSVKQS